MTLSFIPSKLHIVWLYWNSSYLLGGLCDSLELNRSVLLSQFKENGGNEAMWFLRLSHKTPHNSAFLSCSQLPCCEEDQTSPCRETAWRSYGSVEEPAEAQPTDGFSCQTNEDTSLWFQSLLYSQSWLRTEMWSRVSHPTVSKFLTHRISEHEKDARFIPQCSAVLCHIIIRTDTDRSSQISWPASTQNLPFMSP